MRVTLLPKTAGIRRVALALAIGAPASLAGIARIAGAQSDLAARPSTELTLVAGVSQRRQRDETASPLVFGGSGVNAAARLTRRLGADFDATAQIAGTFNRLGSGATAAHEQVADGSASLAVERRIVGSEQTAIGAFALGARVAADLTSNLHQYATAEAPSAMFLMMAASMGPSAAWRGHVGHGRATVALSAPIAGLVSHPYSEAKPGDTPLSLRTATMASLHRLDGGVQFTPDRARRAGLTIDYRFSVMRYDDVQPLRTASQALSIGVATRLGAPAPGR